MPNYKFTSQSLDKIKNNLGPEEWLVSELFSFILQVVKKPLRESCFNGSLASH